MSVHLSLAGAAFLQAEGSRSGEAASTQQPGTLRLQACPGHKGAAILGPRCAHSGPPCPKHRVSRSEFCLHSQSSVASKTHYPQRPRFFSVQPGWSESMAEGVRGASTGTQRRFSESSAGDNR